MIHFIFECSTTMLPVRVLTHNCEQMCFFDTDRGYRCSAARKNAVISVEQENLEHLDPSKEHLTLCFTVVPGFSSSHIMSLMKL